MDREDEVGMKSFFKGYSPRFWFKMRGFTPEESEGLGNKVGVKLHEDTIQGRIINLLNKQTSKGFKKYGHTLDDCPDEKFDWKLMAMEEMIDLIQYQQKEIMRMERLLNP